jgi:hypothetical protein
MRVAVVATDDVRSALQGLGRGPTIAHVLATAKSTEAAGRALVGALAELPPDILALHVHLFTGLETRPLALRRELLEVFRTVAMDAIPVEVHLGAWPARLREELYFAFETFRRPGDTLRDVLPPGLAGLVPIRFLEVDGRLHAQLGATEIPCRQGDARLWRSFLALRAGCREGGSVGCACCFLPVDSIPSDWAKWVDPSDAKGSAADLRAACARIRAALRKVGAGRDALAQLSITGLGPRGARRYGVRVAPSHLAGVADPA